MGGRGNEAWWGKPFETGHFQVDKCFIRSLTHGQVPEACRKDISNTPMGRRNQNQGNVNGNVNGNEARR